MNKRKKLPIGIESFEEMRKEDFYYVDKTRWIEQLLAQWGKVNLFTRPRRFGKSLNMSMLQTFFEVGADASLFDGLYISKNKEVCKQYLGKFPVVSISLKGVNGNTFDEARSCLVKVINREARRLQNLSESEKLTQVDKELFEKLLSQMKDDGTLSSSLLELSELLEKHYEEKVIVLIDEYDVPVAKSNSHGYYLEMLDVMKGLLQVLKDNQALDFAVITGCLKIAKESIFTGTNKLETLLAGGYIIQKIDENLTYDYLHSSEDNLWSILYLTGYLTSVRETELSAPLAEGMTALIIPNVEIKEIFETTVRRWFDESAKEWDRKELFHAVWNGDTEGLTREMNKLLRRTISYHDYKEDFYHTFLAGIFTGAGYCNMIRFVVMEYHFLRNGAW